MVPITLPDGFSAAELTNVLDLMPIKYGEITASGLFKFMGMSTRLAAIQRNTMSLCLVPTSEWCGPVMAKNDRRRKDIVFIDVPHTPIGDIVHPCDISGRILFDLNTQAGLVDMASEVATRMADMRSKLEITKEYRLVRALFGEVLDSDGSVIHDLFADFGYTRTIVDFAFSDEDWDPQIACMQLRRLIRKLYRGLYNGIEARVDPEFFDKMVSHPLIRDSYKRCCDTNALTTTDVGIEGFPFGGILWRENDSEACAVNGAGESSMVQFMASPLDAEGDPIATAGLGVAFPRGTSNNFELLAAPPTMNQYVNKKAESEYYASMEVRCHNEGFDLKTQMNTLPIVKQPQAQILLRAS